MAWSVGITVLGWLAGVWLLWAVPSCRGAVALRRRRISVVVPARNEERTLPTLLRSLASQSVPAHEIVVVDDQSSDGTATVAAEAGARIVAVADVPHGWTGKAWACWTGARTANGDILVFLDADVELAPGALDALVGQHDARGGLVSVQPFHVTERAYERLSAFFNVVGMMGVDAFDPLRGRRAPRGAFGACLVCRRDDYLAIGGHEAVRAAVLEDVALGGRFLAAGWPVVLFGGRDVVSFRMYPGGLAQLVEGWSKNFAQGAGAIRRSSLALVVLWIAGCLVAAAGVRGAAAASAVAYGAYVAQLAWMLRRVGRFGWWPAVLYPIPLAFFLGVFAWSIVLTHVRGEVVWRGRRIPVTRR